MATETLQVRLLMENSQYKREAREASTATGKIGKSAESTTGRFDKLRSGIRAIGPVASIAGLAATAAIGKFAADSIRSASDLNESVNAVRVTFGDAADDILAIGDTSAEAFGLAKSEFNGFAVQFSAFGKTIARETGQSVSGVIQDLTTRISDFASVMNLEVPEAAEKFQSGLAGQTEPLQRFGIDVSAARVEQELLEQGLIDGSRELTQQEKVLGRYLTIMGQTESTAGDFANTSDDLANKQRVFTAQLEDTRAEVGEALLPVMSDLLDVGQDLIPVLVEVGKFIALIARGAAIAAAGSDVERLSIQVGQAADNATGLATAIVDLDRTAGTAAEIRELPNQIRAFIDEAELAPSEIRKVADNMDFLTEEMGLSADMAERVAEVLRDELINSLTGAEESARAALEGTEDYADGLTDAEKAARNAFGPIDKLGGTVDRQGGKWDNLVTSMESYETMLRRLHDPVFAAIDDQRNLDKATQDYLDVIDDPESSVGDQERAMWDLVRAQQAAEESAAALPDDLDAAATSIEILGRRAGITEEDLGRLREMVMSFDGLKANATVGINVVGGERVRGVVDRDIVLRQHGGPVRANQPAIVGEAGPELWIPDHSGTVVPQSHSSTTGAVPMGQTGDTYNFYGDTYGDEGFWRKVREANAQNGRLGLN